MTKQGNVSRPQQKKNIRLSPLLLAMAGIMPVSAMAGIVADAGQTSQPGIESTANGTALININNSNANGLSHNKYSEFDVDKNGVVFNNSMKDGVSQIGGYAMKNNQLYQEANVILNEVTGAKVSYLNGAIEVLGRRADLIIANENGIIVNGVSTINANNLTLSTGRVGFDRDGSVQLAVERGNVSIEGRGIDTTGLSYFDIISRSANLTGEIAGKADVTVLTGLNDYNVNSHHHTVRRSRAEDTPKVAISGSQLGSMYGNRIQLISTESGAGVSHAGSIVGDGGIEITGEGDIRLASVKSNNDSVHIAGASIALGKDAGNSKGGIAAQGDVILDALAAINLQSDIIVNTGVIRINADSLLQSAANLLAKNNSRTSCTIPAIQINIAGRYQIIGSLYAADAHGNRIANAVITLSNGKYVVKSGQTTITDASVLSDASLVSNSGDVAINAEALENGQGVISSAGKLVINLTDALVNNGTIQANGSIELKGRHLKNGGIFSTTDSMKITLGQIENSGSMYAGNISVTTENLVNQGVIISDSGDISVRGGKKSTISNSGLLQSKKAITLEGSKLTNMKAGTLHATDRVTITIADSVENEGKLYAKNIHTQSKSLLNNGELVADSDLNAVASNDIVNGADGVFQSGHLLQLQGATLNNEGDFNSAGRASFDSNLINNKGNIYGSDVDIVTKGFANAGNIIAQNGNLYLINHGNNSAVNEGILQGKNNTIYVDGKLVNHGQITASNALNVHADSVSNHHRLVSQGALNLDVASEIENSGSEALISSADSLSIKGNKTLNIKNSDGAVMQSTNGDVALAQINALLNDAAKIITDKSLTLSDITTVSNNNGQLQGNTITIDNLSRLDNTDDQAVIVASNGLRIANVETLNNTSGSITSQGDIALENIRSLLNTTGSLLASHDIHFKSVDLLKNSEGATISSQYGAVLLSTIKTLQNLSKSMIEARNSVSFDHVTSLENSGDSTIQSEGNIALDQLESVRNAGSILSKVDLVMKNIGHLINEGESALLQGLDITFAKISSIVNQDYSQILAVNKLDMSGVNDITNQSGGFLQGSDINIAADTLKNSGYETQIVGGNNVVINANSVSNLSQAGIFSDGGLNIHADHIENGSDSDLSAQNYTLIAQTLLNRGTISSQNNNGLGVINALDIDNHAGRIINRGSLRIAANKLDNHGEGNLWGGKVLELDLQGDIKNGDYGTFGSSGKLSLTTTGNVTIDKPIESYGTVAISAKDIINDSSLVSAGDIYLSAINIINNMNALIYSIKDSFLKATGTIFNNVKGNILSQHQLHLTASTIHNRAGVIRSEGDMWLDAPNIHNESTYKNVNWDYSTAEKGEAKVSDEGTFDSRYYNVKLNVPGLTSDLALDTRAEISSGGVLNINQNLSSKSETNNEGGLIQSKDTMRINGDLYNVPKHVETNSLTFLKNHLSEDIVLNFKHSVTLNAGGNNRDVDLKFHNLYDMLNFIYGSGGVAGVNLGNQINVSGYRDFFGKAINKLASTHTALNDLMNKLFGEQWKNDSHSDMVNRWSALISYSGRELNSKKIYFLPADKATIIAGKDFIHKAGSFNNGIASELDQGVQKNKIVDVTVGDKTVNTVNQGYDVKFNKKNIAEITMGISTLPGISTLIEIKGLFAKSQTFLDSIVAISRSGTASATSAGVTAANGPTYQIIPMYETRPSMIDQSQYYGSDYFFKSVGYTSDRPVIVVGDNYFVSELIRRQLNESVGSFFAVQYNVEGADLVRMLFDNAGELATDEADSSFTVGTPLTDAQIKGLKKDIVWFVTEKIDGVDVLVPKIYLAQQTIADIKTVNETGTAVVHAGGNANVDASHIHNANAVISAGNNVSLTADKDINNISSGMNAGIKAGGTVSITSKSGDITNSGSQIAAGKDVSLSAEKGNIEMIASVGRDDKGNQKIGAFQDGVTAGTGIKMQAKDISVSGIALKGGADKGSDVVLTATDGNVKFDDLHEVESSFDYDSERTGFFSHRATESSEVSANSKTSSVETGGKFVVNAAKDAVFNGGDYSASAADIRAGNNVTVGTSQDLKEEIKTVSESSLVVGASLNAPGAHADYNYSQLDGESSSFKNTGYESAASQSQLNTANTKKPGVAPTSDLGSFRVGIQTVETTDSHSSVTNKNTGFNFSQGADIHAGKNLDIGGMDLTSAQSATSNLSGNNIVSTKYEDVDKKTHEKKETFSGVKAEVHSSLVDAVNKTTNLAIKSGSEGQEVNAARTSAEVAGDLTNVMFNDTAGGSVSVGWSMTKNSGSSEKRAQNTTTLKGGTINLNSTANTTLKGVNVDAGDVNVTTGGDFNLSAAETTKTSSSSMTSHNAGVSLSGGFAPAGGAGIGASVDYSGSKSDGRTDDVDYSRANIKSDSFNVKTGGDMSMTGANVNTRVADVDVTGDLSITSVQDKHSETSTNANWGGSVGAAISTSGILPTIAVSGGGGSEQHIKNSTKEQSGINSKEGLTVTTGGDLNLTGAHLVDENKAGSVEVSGKVNAKDLVDNTDESGMSQGGGLGISYKGLPSGHYYNDTIDEVHYKEEQHSTVNVNMTGSQGGSSLNTDASAQSTVTEDRKIAGNNISISASVVKKKSKGQYDVKNSSSNHKIGSYKPASDSGSSKPVGVKPSTSKGSTTGSNKPIKENRVQDAFVPPQTASSGTVNKLPAQSTGTPKVSVPSTPGTSDSKVNESRAPVKPTQTHTASSEGVNKLPAQSTGTPTAVRPQGATAGKGSPSSTGGKTWPTVKPSTGIVGGPGSSSSPGLGNFPADTKPANNAQPRNNAVGAPTGKGSTSLAPAAVKKADSSLQAQQQPRQTSEKPGSASDTRVNESRAPVKPTQTHTASSEGVNKLPAQSTGTPTAVRPQGATAGKGSPSSTGGKTWPTVMPSTGIIGGPGSSSGSGLGNYAGSAKPVSNVQSLKPGESSGAQNGWKSLMPNQTIQKSDSSN